MFGYDFYEYLILCFQKQPPRGVLKERRSENMQQIYRKIYMPKCDFNKVAKQSKFIEIALRHGCSPVNLLHIFRTPFFRSTSGWLPLCFAISTTEKKIHEDVISIVIILLLRHRRYDVF